MEDGYSYEDLKAVIDTQYKVLEDFNASCIRYIENVNEGNFKEYQKILAMQGERGKFNLFEVIYPRWWHENFHSKMLKFSLESYPEFFDNFLELIDDDKNIPKENYGGYTVQCEYPCEWDGKSGRIDLAIFSGNGKRVIIIENKLNWACDQDFQLYRYNEGLKKQEYMVDKIVYLTPLKSDPSENSLGSSIDVRGKIINIVGFSENPNLKNLVSCLGKIKIDKLEEDYRVFLKHYIGILKQTGVGDMSIIAGKFLEEIKKSGDENIKKLAYIKEMLDSLPNAREKYWLDNLTECEFTRLKGKREELRSKEYRDSKDTNIYYRIEIRYSSWGETWIFAFARAKPDKKAEEYQDRLKKRVDKETGGFQNSGGSSYDGWCRSFNFLQEDEAVLVFVKKLHDILTNLSLG